MVGGVTAKQRTGICVCVCMYVLFYVRSVPIMAKCSACNKASAVTSLGDVGINYKVDMGSDRLARCMSLGRMDSSIYVDPLHTRHCLRVIGGNLCVVSNNRTSCRNVVIEKSRISVWFLPV